MKCRICKDEINLTIAGMPDDICWGCLTKEDQIKVVNKNSKKGCECETCERLKRYAQLMIKYNVNKEDHEFFEGLWKSLDAAETDAVFGEMDVKALMEHIKNIVNKYKLPVEEIPDTSRMSELRYRYNK